MKLNKANTKKYNDKVKSLKTTDEIKEILMYYQPLYEDDLLSVKGVEQDWISKNKDFIKFIEKIRWENDVDLNRKTQIVLENFTKKLALFNQKSSMVWNGKINSKKHIDLFPLEAKSINEIKNNLFTGSTSKKIVLKFKKTSLNKNFGDKIREDFDKYEKIVEDVYEGNDISKITKDNAKIIYRDANYRFLSEMYKTDNEIKKEFGTDMLYLANYYIEGNLRSIDNDLAIRAPLFLFPVKMFRNEIAMEIKIVADQKRDVIVNTFVLQNILKIGNFSYDQSKSPEENVKKLFTKNIDYDFDKNLSSFVTKTNAEVISNLKWKVNNHLTLGIFQIYDNSIQQEIADIVNYKKVSKNIVETFSEYDIYNADKQSKFDKEVEEIINDDNDLFYVDKLNYQQSVALKKINLDNLNHLTIWGPPGTGKSQTILSIIIDALIKNKKIAVVAEKKVALDVIYERLGELKNFALLITDINKKIDFYDQIRGTFDFLKEINIDEIIDKNIDYAPVLKNNLDNLDKINLSNKIEEFDNKTILEVLGELQQYKIDSKELKNFLKYKNDFSNFNSMSYKDIFSIFKFINDNFTISGLKEFSRLNKKYKKYNSYDELVEEKELKLGNLTQDLVENDEKKEDLERINELIFEFKKIKLLSLFKRRKFIKNIKAQTYLKNKRQIVKFNQEEQYIKLINIEDDLNNEIKFLEREIESIKSNKWSIEQYKRLNNSQLDWINKIIKYDKDKKVDEDVLNNLNKIMLNFLIEDLIINNNIYKIAEAKINNWKTQVEKINSLQEEIIQNNSQKVIKKVVEQFINDIDFNNRAKTIEKVANAKKHAPILNFFKKYALEVKNSYPIWLVRPEVMSNIFYNNEKFDIILVDEASQLFIEQSLPSLQHSKKIVVLGDEKQLSPSSFFKTKIGDDEEEIEEINYIEDEDSLLDFAKTKFPSVMLKNHYRSNFSELIGYSNVKFYNSKLIATNNNNSVGAKPIEFVPVKNGIFEKGINVNEAKEVINVIKKISKDIKLKKLSLGIITMNNAQKDLTEEAINNASNKDTTLKSYLSKANLFVKAIENVQGDERDIIIFSSTYGLDNNGNLSVRFGPINNQGGENRINVAVTRSKEKMFIVSSIDSSLLKGKVQNAKNNGPRVFADFLDYAQNPTNWLENNTPKNATQEEVNEENYIQEIYKKLKKKIESKFGYTLIKDTINFGIDYIVYDEKTSQNIMAIEVDLNAFKGAKFARERDISKYQYLESRGWNVYRLWTVSWFKDEKREIKSILNRIENLKK